MKLGQKIYINEIYGTCIDIVYFCQDLNESQILVQCNNKYSVINKNIIVQESEYIEYINSIYKDNLKKLKEFILFHKIDEESLTKMLNDLKSKRIIND